MGATAAAGRPKGWARWTPGLVEQARGLEPDQRNAFIAALLGWTMDAYDYFLVVLVYAAIAKDFGVSLTRMAFAPNYTVLLVLRLLYGIGMGGEWGLGAALAMEKIPASKRGLFSGLLQQGYPLGFLLATVTYLVIRTLGGNWRVLFAFSLVPAMVVLYVRTRVGESEAWERTAERVRLTQVTARQVFFNAAILRRFVFLVILMTAFNWMSHGTQDVYKTYLTKGLHFSDDTALGVTAFFNVGAIIGGTLLGAASERFGRRRTIVVSALLGLPIIPLFAYSTTLGAVMAGSFLMQFFVQGAWGVVPAHLSELSPDEIRGFYPGVTYQLGNCIAAFNLPIQESLAKSHSYSFALTATVIPVFCAVALLAWLGSEAKGVHFGRADVAAYPDAARRPGAVRSP